jgi:hypothetical protein
VGLQAAYQGGENSNKFLRQLMVLHFLLADDCIGQKTSVDMAI